MQFKIMFLQRMAMFGIIACALCPWVNSARAAADSLADLEHCNVIWDTPSQDSKGSMPIGNGDIGANVWIEPSGDLVFFISKTDAWDENVRLLKLGKVRVKFTPSLVQAGKPFTQTLQLTQGRILIKTDDVEVSFWIDANYPVVQVDAKSLTGQPIAADVTMEPWRTTKRYLGQSQGGGDEYFGTSYTSLPAFSYPDAILPMAPKQIGWYHRNVVSPWPQSMKLQKLEALIPTQQDPILNRTIGGIIRGDSFVAVSKTELKTAQPATEFSLRIHVLTQITDTPEQWSAALEKQAAAVENLPSANRWKAHTAWWNAFWDRSWIFVNASQSCVIPISVQPWRVGIASDGRSKFGGAISDPQVIAGALSAEDIAKLAAQPHTDAAKLMGADADLAKGFTVAAWIKPAPGDAGRILDKCTNFQADGSLLDAYPGLSLRWLVGNRAVHCDYCLTPNEWQHVAATVDPTAGVLRIYRNGKLIQTSDDQENDPAKIVTRGYALQRWINACGGRGAFPIKFNGSIFVVDNRADADYRAWGGGYWNQNTRLLYWSMLEAGDFDLMQPWFNMYMKALPARQLAAKTYYGHVGAFFPETMTFWGNYLDQAGLGYGVNRAGKPDGLTDNEYIRYHWQGGIEMVALMLDYYDLTQDTQFRDTTLIPYAKEIVTFFDQHWKRGADGKIVMHPSQALETFWDCTNPMPEVAGLHSVLPRLINLTDNAALKMSWQKTLADLPPVPVDQKAKVFLPAEKFARKNNGESPEFYGVFPYCLYTVASDKQTLAIALNSWPKRQGGNGGWYQNAIFAALLGQTQDARNYVVGSASAHAAGFRFPAMWGPNFNWTPDQDHGSVLECALQRMALQYQGDKVLLLPAWPKDWNVSFKLHAPYRTTIEGVYQDGKIANLIVTPPERSKDVIIMIPGQTPESKLGTSTN